MLNMGQPVKIVDWQGSNSLRIKVGKDIDIRFTGATWEKIVRRTVDFGEQYEPTEHVKFLLSAPVALFQKILSL